MNERKKQAKEILEELNQDLITGTRSYFFFESIGFRKLLGNKTSADPMLNIIRRMSLSHVFLALSKFHEWYRRFKSEIPEDCKDACKELYRNIGDKGIVKFRNNRIGHIWDKKLDRPLTFNEVDEIINKIVSHDEGAFLLWVNNPKKNDFPKTVVSVIERTHDQIKLP